ncbi:MAG TPA: M15 family metallopeptidase [Candidatus Baltobacteraceae bacterium]
MKRSSAALGAAALAGLLAATPRPHGTLPPGFVYLSDVAPSIVQDMRYAGDYNLVGRPIAGYDAPECVLTKQAAQALAGAQREIGDIGLTLRVYDCYAPTRATGDLVAWSKNPSDQAMKAAFYPRVPKTKLFALGFLDVKSAHSRGSSVDVTIERLPLRDLPRYAKGDALYSCVGPYRERYHDGSIDMGTTFDCMDELSRTDADVGPIAASHRQTLATVMHKHGFTSHKEEWWHYTLRWEPFPKTYFDFPIESR